MDLKKLDVSELANLQADIQSELRRKQQQKRQDVINQVKSLLAENGMSLDDLPGRSSAAKSTGRSKVAPKYRNKSDPEQTWSGRGRKPRWVSDYLAQGGDLQDIAI